MVRVMMSSWRVTSLAALTVYRPLPLREDQARSRGKTLPLQETA
jgi:hypothetical protein